MLATRIRSKKGAGTIRTSKGPSYNTDVRNRRNANDRVDART